MNRFKIIFYIEWDFSASWMSQRLWIIYIRTNGKKKYYFFAVGTEMHTKNEFKPGTEIIQHMGGQNCIQQQPFP